MSGNDKPPAPDNKKPSTGGMTFDWKSIGGRAAACGAVAAGITFLMDSGGSAELFGMSVPTAVALGVSTAAGSAVGEMILQGTEIRNSSAAIRLGRALEPLAVATSSIAVMYGLGYVDIADFQTAAQLGAIAAVSGYAGNALYEVSNMKNFLR